jgi:hypothetical protein
MDFFSYTRAGKFKGGENETNQRADEKALCEYGACSETG